MDTSLHAVELQPTPAVAASAGLSPLALWHLLSLDAPTVAATWTWFVARALHVTLSPAIPVAMFLAVWVLYATDRLLDTRSLQKVRHTAGTGKWLSSVAPAQDLEARHIFHHQHRRRFRAAIVAASLMLLALLSAFPREDLRRYLFLAGLLLLWFVVIHVFSAEKPLPKELLPGPYFAAAIFIPCARCLTPELTLAAIFFALLCTENCLYIFAWEHAADAAAHAATRLGLRLLTPLTWLTFAIPLCLVPLAPSLAPVFIAIAAASLLLLLLDQFRRHFDATDLRAAADLVLLTPLLVAPFLR